MANVPSATIRPAKAPQLVFVCAKCSRKLGPAGKAIRNTLKHALKSRRWGKARLVKTSCFSICPKSRQVIASARSLSAGKVLMVEENFAVDATLDDLLGFPL